MNKRETINKVCQTVLKDYSHERPHPLRALVTGACIAYSISNGSYIIQPLLSLGFTWEYAGYHMFKNRSSIKKFLKNGWHCIKLKNIN